MAKKQHLSTIFDELETNLDTYRQNAIKTDKENNSGSNEWLLQIADIYKAAYGEELDLDNVIVD